MMSFLSFVGVAGLVFVVRSLAVVYALGTQDDESNN
jgi:hypothetical protein